jgi:hypothetical protein
MRQAGKAGENWHEWVPKSKRRCSVFKVSLCLILGLLVAAPVLAQESQSEGLTLSDSRLTKETFQSGTFSLEVYAGRAVDVWALLRAAKVGKDETAQTIQDKINEARLQLYPNETIVLSIGPSVMPRSRTDGLFLVKAYVMWNYRGNWSATWTSATAILFVDDVRVRGYTVYDCFPCGGWKNRSTVGVGASNSRYNYGFPFSRGFRVVGGAGSQADIVAYFFV